MKLFSKKVAAIIAVSALTFTAASFSVSATEVNSELSVSVNAGNDWDALLDSYESYVNQYIKTMEKAKAGDATALTSYASMLKKSQDLQKKLENASSDMTPEQLARYQKINAKLLKAMQSGM